MIAWLLTLPLAMVGSQVAHALAYRLAAPHGASNELAATGHGYLAYAPVALAICVVLVVVALAGEVRHLLRAPATSPTPPSVLRFAVLAPAIFVCQEHFERLLHDGAFPWTAALQPTFVIGLLLQLPFALVAYVLASLLLRAVRSLGLIFVAPPRLPERGRDALRPAFRAFAPRVPVLALGYGSRGPPALLPT